MDSSQGILVGVDGSPESYAAVDWAAREAAARHCDLAIVHACDPRAYGLWIAPKVVREGLRDLTRPLVEKAMTRAQAVSPEVAVHGKVIVAAPSRALIRLSSRAQLTVIGRTGQGALSRIIAGSITTRLLANAASPVVAVVSPAQPDSTHQIDRVVVAVDDVATHAKTLRFAFETAARHGVALQMLRVIPDGYNPAAETGVIATGLTSWLAEFPTVPHSYAVRTGHLVALVAETCEPHDLLVLGHHRHTPFMPHSLGWTTTSALHAVKCPIAVVPEQVDAIREPVEAPAVAVLRKLAPQAQLASQVELTPHA